MKVGTKTILFGFHNPFIHSYYVLKGWIKLFGFPTDLRIWISIFVHDLGYWGKSNLDGEEGETHPELGGRIMRVFGEKWESFTLYHSRFYAKNNNSKVSKLCLADKMAIILTPIPLTLFLMRMSDEINEYMSGIDKYDNEEFNYENQYNWSLSVKNFLTHWIQERLERKDYLD